MLFNSYFFILIFLPVTLMIYLWLEASGRHSARMQWLLAASLFFYGWWNPVYLILLMASIGINYFMGSILEGRYGVDECWRYSVLVSGVSANLVLIGYFKYYNFFIGTANTVLGTQYGVKNILLPLAISFFTFQQIAYLVDAYRGETKDYSLLQYSIFVSFFPQLIAGPIVHHSEVLPQFHASARKRDVATDFSIGLTIFCLGLFKKVMIADNFALIATPVFAAGDQGIIPGFFDAWRGAFSYSFQLYFDFSGYSDMAIGLGRMFGIRIPLNFHSPYRSASIIEFWRRWHITLSRFLRKYLYFPLGGNRKGPLRRYVNLMVTMLLGGLWHGAGWTFVLWGGVHGLMLAVNHFFRTVWRRPVQSFWGKALSRFFTFLCVTLAWVLFRAETLGGAMNIFKGMINFPYTLKGRIGPIENILEAIGAQFNGPWITFPDYFSLPWLLAWVMIIWFWPNTHEWLSLYGPALDAEQHIDPEEIPTWTRRFRWQPAVLWGGAVAIVGLLSFLNLSQPTEFLYFQF